jgi:hypothetical protein
VLKLRRFRQLIINTWKILKIDAGDGWKISVGPIMWEMKKCYLESMSRLKERRGYSHLKEEALDRTMWRNRFGGGFEPVIRQNTEWMNEWMNFISDSFRHTGCYKKCLCISQYIIQDKWLGWGGGEKSQTLKSREVHLWAGLMVQDITISVLQKFTGVLISP